MIPDRENEKITAGRAGEKAAADYLLKNGYTILSRNYRCPAGELDIVAREKKEIVFVEVKARKSHVRGYPEQAVGFRKQKKMSQLALWYLQEHQLLDRPARFDVVAVTLLADGPQIRLIRNAFDFIP
ncbi:MAG TPA: YraN family protein [Smithellaceae bacterium]|nr:YraN family protein [Smithellaceae bacterium]